MASVLWHEIFEEQQRARSDLGNFLSCNELFYTIACHESGRCRPHVSELWTVFYPSTDILF